MRCTCSSLSITHGPAISTSGRAPKALNSIDTGKQRLLFGRQALHTIFVRSPDECFEQGMRLHRLGLEFRVKLAAQEPRVADDFADLHVGAVRRFAGDPQAR